MERRRRPRAVLAEDDPSFRELVRIYLEALGLEVVEFSEGKSPMDQLVGLEPDLVCTDLMLPQFSGYDICEFIRRTPSLKKVPVLFMSSRGSPTDRAHAEEAGANAYLVKPFTQAEFVVEIVALLPDLALWLDPKGG
jgi:two-component system chemotaxis response regulator CheY